MMRKPVAERFSLSRWSRRKLAAARRANEGSVVPAAEPATAAPVGSVSSLPSPTPPSAGAAELPPVESLTFDSDFAPFFKPEVDETVKRAALKQLFRDPRFNVMDGLDVYIDDYTRSDPIPAEMLEKLVQYRYILNPPRTELNAEGNVVDVPSEPSPERTDASAPNAAATPAETDAAASPAASAGEVVAPIGGGVPEGGAAKA